MGGGGENQTKKGGVFGVCKWEELFQGHLGRCLLSPMLGRGAWMLTESRFLIPFPWCQHTCYSRGVQGFGRQPLSSSFHRLTTLRAPPPPPFFFFLSSFTAPSPSILASYLPEFATFLFGFYQNYFFPFRGLLGFNSSLA